MNYQDTISILKLKTDITDIKQLKFIYHQLAKKYHSDLNQVKNDTMMQLLNNCYSWAKDNLPICVDTQQATNDISSDIEQAIDAIKHLQNINIELCGSWLWVTGNTKQYKDIFKQNNFRWSPKKSSWYFAPQSDKKYKYRGKKTLDEIRTFYGSKTINKTYRQAIGG